MSSKLKGTAVSDLRVGTRLSYGGDLCTVRYIGEVKGTKGEWLGVEWDDASRGKHDGQAGGVKYFTCE
jgi:dynactin complex subunit